MTDPIRDPRRGVTSDNDANTGTRRWWGLAAIVAAIVILLVVVMMLLGGGGGGGGDGGHNPGRHFGQASVGTQPHSFSTFSIPA